MAREKTVEQVRAQARELARERGWTPFEGDAHAYLIHIYTSQDPEIPLPVKVDAAKAAIRYEKPALSSIEASGKDGGPIEHGITVTFVKPSGD